MVTVRTRKLWTCLPGEAALNRWTATDKRWNKKVIYRGSVVASPFDLRQEFLGTDTHGAKCFQGHWKEFVLVSVFHVAYATGHKELEFRTLGFF